MIWIFLLIGLIVAAPIALFGLSVLASEVGLSTVVVMGFTALIAFGTLPIAVAACTTLMIGAIWVVCWSTGIDHDERSSHNV